MADKDKKIKLFENEKLREKVVKKTDGEILKCFNCGTCTASCPVSSMTDFNPRRILRKISLGMDVTEDITPCVSCFTCNARCPNGIDIAKIIDIIKIEYQKSGRLKGNPVIVFNKAFLDTVEKYGKLYEVEMLAKYKLKSGDLFGDAELGLPLMLRGKMGLLPHKSKNARAVKEIFKKVREIEQRE